MEEPVCLVNRTKPSVMMPPAEDIRPARALSHAMVGVADAVATMTDTTGAGVVIINRHSIARDDSQRHNYLLWSQHETENHLSCCCLRNALDEWICRIGDGLSRRLAGYARLQSQHGWRMPGNGIKYTRWNLSAWSTVRNPL